MPAKDLFLKDTKSFQKIIKEGRKCFSPHFILYILERTDKKSKARLGIAVPKKAVSLAVKRNRIKRVLREIWRAHANTNNNKDFLLITRKDVFSKTYNEIFKELNSEFDKFLS